MTFGSSDKGGFRRRWMLTAAVLIAVSLMLGACGRKGEPDHPEGAEFPKTYPAE